MIILEGPDGAGKSTLVNELVEEYGFEVGERGTKDRKLLYTVTRSDTYNALSQGVRGNCAPKIWDRLFFSELVYADIVGRPVEFSRTEQQYIHRVLWALGCPVIVCLPPLEVVQANAAKDEQMDGVNENIAEIWHRYDDLQFSGRVMWYDYTGSEGFSVRHSFSAKRAVMSNIDEYLSTRKEREVSGSVATAS